MPLSNTLYRGSFKAKHLEVLKPNFTKKGILENKFAVTVFKKTILELKISNLDYIFVPSFILKKAL